jgi:hypothetical protein
MYRERYHWAPLRLAEEDLLLYIDIYYSEITGKNKQIPDFREVYSSQKCPPLLGGH